MEGHRPNADRRPTTQIRRQSRRRLSRIAVGVSCLHCMLGAQLLDLHPGRRKRPHHATKDQKAEGKNVTDLLPPTGKLLLRLFTRSHTQRKGCALFLLRNSPTTQYLPIVHLTTFFLRKPRAHPPGHAPALWRTNLVAEWHVTVCLAVNGPPRQTHHSHTTSAKCNVL